MPHLVVLTALLGVAAVMDVRTRKVPNWISASLFASGLVVQAMVHGWRAGAIAAAVALGLGLLLLVPWSMRVVGGGDLKLAVAAAAWMSAERIVPFVLATAIAGGVLALPFIRNFGHVWRTAVLSVAPRGVGVRGGGPQPRRHVPFAVAIALGSALVAVR